VQETKKIADEAKRIGEEAHEQAKKVGQEYETPAQAGFEAASRSFSDANRGFQMIAAEMTEYSKKTLEDVFRAWEQLVRARSYSDVVDIQTRYAQRAYEAHAEEMSKLTDLYLNLTRDTSKPGEQAGKNFS
jgi:hypothetical protein